MHNFPIVVSSRMVAVSRHQYQLRAVPLFKPPNVFFTYLHPPVGVSWLDYPTLPKKASRAPRLEGPGMSTFGRKQCFQEDYTTGCQQ